MKKYFEILKKCPLFQEIEEEDLLRMLTCLGAKVESFDRKYTILAEGKPARHIGIILTGRIYDFMRRKVSSIRRAWRMVTAIIRKQI